MAGRPEAHVARGFAPRVSLRERPDPGPRWRELWRARTPGEHRRVVPAWPGSGSLRNGLPGGAKLRSGRAGCNTASPASSGRGRHVRHTPVCRGDRTSDRRRPSSRSMSPRSASGRACAAKDWRGRVKAVVKPPRTLRRRWSVNEPARKQRPARAGAAPREGKALEGSSRDASGRSPVRGAAKSAKRRGPRRKPRACRNRREGQEP